MFVNDVNELKIFNLSAGKSIPEWLTDRRKRSQLRKKIDTSKHIELIQDFDMPGVCTSIKMSPDNLYILATGTYKPRVKCFEVLNLSIKFERCFDSEVTAFEVLSEDYSKIAFLQCDRYVEFHAAPGRHYRLRIPRFGRDLKYHSPSCDLFLIGTSSDIYRLNLERGQFLQPFTSEGSCLNACDINPVHHLLVTGSKEGIVEAWDPRERKRCASLDVAVKLTNTKTFPSISALKFKNELQMAVGTESGHVLLYDLRSREPLLIKDHLNKLPIKRLNFNPEMNAVYSLDGAMLKIWNEQTGKQMAYIESQKDFNDFCTIPKSGMFFLAQEDVKMLTYYIPGLGPAPRWCSFLDNLTEEIQSEQVQHIYDDYQFVTKKDLDELGLDNLIGTNLLRAYMHGYFMDARLYAKAKAVSQPFAFDQFRKDKVREQVAAQRPSRLQLNTDLPKVNRDLALKIMEEAQEELAKKKPKKMKSLLEDIRFKTIFENPDFTIDKNAEEYKMLAPVLNRLEKTKSKEKKMRIELNKVQELHADETQVHDESDNDEDLFDENPSSDENEDDEEESSDDEYGRDFQKEMKKAYKQVKKDRENSDEDDDDAAAQESNRISSSEKNSTQVNRSPEIRVFEKKTNKLSLEERLRKEQLRNVEATSTGGNRGNKQMKFEIQSLTKDMKKREYEMKKHREERRKLVRRPTSLKLKRLRLL